MDFGEESDTRSCTQLPFPTNTWTHAVLETITGPGLWYCISMRSSFLKIFWKKVNKSTLGCNGAMQEGTWDSLQFLTNLAAPSNYPKCENVVWSQSSQNRSVVLSSVRCKKGSWEEQGRGMSKRQWKSHCGPGKRLFCMNCDISLWHFLLCFMCFRWSIWFRWFIWLSIQLQVVTTDLPAGSTSVNLYFHHFCGRN